MITTIMVLLFIFALILLLWQISNIVSVFYGSPYVMADNRIIRQALKLAKLKKGEVFYDLGCGRGDVLIEAVRSGAKCTGYEISPFYYLLAKMRIWIWRVYYSKRWSVQSDIFSENKPEINIRHKNIYSIDLSRADVVYVYLLPKILEKLAPKFQKELKKSARLISIGFRVSGLKLVSKTKLDGGDIFIYSRFSPGRLNH